MPGPRELLQETEYPPDIRFRTQTFDELVHLHPHIHAITTDGAFLPNSTFLCRPKIDSDKLLTTWQTKVFELLVAVGKIDQQTVDHMRSWPHSGFSVDNSVYLAPRDTEGLERLAQYMMRCPFRLARVVRLTDDGSVVYHAEKDQCGRFPGPASADLRGGPRRNFHAEGEDTQKLIQKLIGQRGRHGGRFAQLAAQVGTRRRRRGRKWGERGGGMRCGR